MFEPDPQDATKTTSLVATCGGNSICIIDVNSGTVLMKYKHKDIKETNEGSMKNFESEILNQ